MGRRFCVLTTLFGIYDVLIASKFTGRNCMVHTHGRHCIAYKHVLGTWYIISFHFNLNAVIYRWILKDLVMAYQNNLNLETN